MPKRATTYLRDRRGNIANDLRKIASFAFKLALVLGAASYVSSEPGLLESAFGACAISVALCATACSFDWSIWKRPS
jgi:hypothetical protein